MAGRRSQNRFRRATVVALTALIALSVPSVASAKSRGHSRDNHARVHSPRHGHQKTTYNTSHRTHPHRNQAPKKQAAINNAAASDPSYQQAVLADDPSVYYRLDETSGTTAFDSSGNGIDGTYGSDVALGIPGALRSDSDTAIQANDNTNNNIAMTASAQTLPSGSAPRTVEFWFQGGCCVGGTYGQVVNVLSYGSDFSIGLIRNNGAFVSITGNGVTINQPTVSDVFNNGWHLFDIALDGSSASVYVDGQLQGKDALTTNTDVTVAGLVLGDAESENSEGDQYDELAIYPTALAPTSIEAHWTAGTSPTATLCGVKPTSTYSGSVLADHPDVYYGLGDLSVSRVAYDSSGNCLNGAYSNVDAVVPGAIDSDPSHNATETVSNSNNIAVTANDQTLPSGSAPRTVEFWFQGGCCVGSTYGSVEPIVTYGSDFSIGLVSNNGGFVALTGNGVTVEQPTVTQVFNNGWHLFDVALDGPSASVYMDGQLQGTDAFTTNTDVTAAGLVLGAATSENGEFDQFDDVAIYPTALSSDQIQTHYTYATLGPPPTVTGLDPSAGPTSGGTSVTITGTNFTGLNGPAAVQFGGVDAASYSVISDTSVVAAAPQESAGIVAITVTGSAGTSAINDADQFAYDAVPVVSGISPNTGPASGGTSVTVTGVGLSGAVAVSFGTSAAASYAANSPTQITATSPPAAPGIVDVSVTTPGGTSSTGDADQFTFTPSRYSFTTKTLTTDAGQEVKTVNLATFTDSETTPTRLNARDFQAQVNWDDPSFSSSPATVTGSSRKGFKIDSSLVHEFCIAGKYTFAVTVTDRLTNISGTAKGQIIVSQVSESRADCAFGEVLTSTGTTVSSLNGTAKSCSGTMVNSGSGLMVITAAHCLHLNSNGTVADHIAAFIPGLRLPLKNFQPFGIWISRAIFMDPRYSNASNTSADSTYDYAFLKLDPNSCFVEGDGQCPISGRPLASDLGGGLPIEWIPQRGNGSMIFDPGSKPSSCSPSFSNNDALGGSGPDLMVEECAMHDANNEVPVSGSPWIDRNSNQIVAVTSKAGLFSFLPNPFRRQALWGTYLGLQALTDFASAESG